MNIIYICMSSLASLDLCVNDVLVYACVCTYTLAFDM